MNTVHSRPWYKHYPKELKTDINPDRYSSLLHFLKDRMATYKDLPALENMGKVISYGELDALSTHLAAYLQQEAGLQQGDRIALQMPNTLQYPIAIIGALKAGLVIVNTNPLYTPREMEHQFRDSGAKAIIILENFADKLEKVIANTSIKKVIVTRLGDMLGTVKGTIVNMAVKYIKKMVPPYHLPGAIAFKDCLQKGKSATYKEPALKHSDLAFLQYTGGTTGLSKGAMLSHRNLLANLEQLEVGQGYMLKKKEEIFITALPLYHIYALTYNCFHVINQGGKSVLITNPRDMKAFLKELTRHKFTNFAGINTLYNGMMQHPDFAKVDFSYLRNAVAGGMALQKPIAERWEKLTGVPVIEGYGLTETSPILSSNLLEGKHRLGTIGVPAPETDMVILDEEEKELPPGQPGEICAYGPQVFSGYWNQPEESRKAFTKDGKWFKTGDIGIMDDEGFFRIVDRKKDMILVSGFNVYPTEIEEVLASHPKVLESGVVGVTDDKSTEVVKAYIVKKDESLTEEEIRNFCIANLTPYKRPKYIEFRTELPKTNVGKILRRELKSNNETVMA
jgi:long-chain acyl-CoA synthetase